MIYVLSGLLAGMYAAMVIGFWRDVRRFGKWKEAIGFLAKCICSLWMACPSMRP